MKIREVLKHLDELVPRKYQESYDNTGLIIGSADVTITGVITCLDSTEEVIDEAIAMNCNLVIAHHPIIFTGIKKLSGNDYISKTIRKAIKNDIAIFAIHTNLDNLINNGVNTKICDRLGLINYKPMIPKIYSETTEGEIGTGILADLPEEMDPYEFILHVAKQMETNCIKYTELINRPIKKVAICGGSGAFLLKHAIHHQADIFISSDFKYHEYFDANGKIIIADLGHYESEKFTMELLLELIQNKFTTFAAHCTKVNTNPVKYLK